MQHSCRYGPKNGLVDALAFAKRLRQKKNKERRLVLRKYKENKSLGKKVISELVQRYRLTRSTEVEAANVNIKHIAEKNDLERIKKQAPSDTMELLGNVNVFSESKTELGRAQPLGPMIFQE